MTTLAAVVDGCREDFLLAGSRERRTQLNGALTDVATSFDVDSVVGITAGTRIAINYEEMHVWSVAGTTLTVYRGDGGTIAAAHNDNDIVTIDPEFSAGKVKRAVDAVVEDLRHEPGLYRVTYLDFEPPHTVEMPLTAHPDATSETGTDHVIEVLMETDDPSEPWIRANSWDVVQFGSSDVTPTPVVMVYEANRFAQTIRIVLRQSLGVIAAGTDIETEVGILNTDLLSVGAALRLGAGRAIRRTSLHSQGDARRANEVAPFSTTSSTRDLEKRYKKLLNSERIRLLQQFPVRRHQR